SDQRLLHVRALLVPASTLFPYTTLFRSGIDDHRPDELEAAALQLARDLFGQLGARRYRMRMATQCLAAGEGPAERGEVLTLLLRSEEHTSELQSHLNLVCRLLLEKNTER